ncbi:helix-turn-helix transcriptional regulator [Chryseobacterium sp. ISL-6]|uniref:helix-turn-helix domain-containing protein n=1 Tax=Chryseobacterium sp. ISL-6 TaxID=2819143 RepID=UPI001BE54F40|nr:helix-turn-helix transcriptional regulator [Chryseobacterium sp. ISL-6]MBT2622653.1 helix-turn-helix transcriptional regulator [Chryseobacterium sp. ISL-6]
MEEKQINRIKTISEFHQSRNLLAPEHPLISIIDFGELVHLSTIGDSKWIFDFYQISLKRGIGLKMKYGQQEYDFDKGVMSFMAPNQIFKIEIDLNTIGEPSGWVLLIHPDLFWNTSLAKELHRYGFFDYSVNEALFLSQKEETTMSGIIDNIRQEYQLNIDKFSKHIIVSHIEVLLNYSERFYNRQFITREKSNYKVLEGLEKLLADYFEGDQLVAKGLPTVPYIADALNLSPKYLTGLLKVLTGQSTQQHIHDKLIEKAKERLSTTNLSVSEIAYELGFEHSQSFSKLFKSKTSLSPIEFRQSFN